MTLISLKNLILTNIPIQLDSDVVSELIRLCVEIFKSEKTPKRKILYAVS